MRKIFILGGSDLQLDLILEAKKMFFYTIVLDMNEMCIGSKWCDEFLPINIADKELVLEKAIEYKIDVILTSATELGNITACWVGEKMGLFTNSYEVALNTTNKIRMKKVFAKHNIETAKHKLITQDNKVEWHDFPCIVKPVDSSAGRGLSYCQNHDELLHAYEKARSFSRSGQALIEAYIKGEQFSIETLSVDGKHQVLTVTKEFIRGVPNIVETHQQIPADIDESLKNKIEAFSLNVLHAFEIQYGACHIEVRVDDSGQIYIIELASRVGGWRTEMLALAFGISYSQLLLFSALNIDRKINVVNSYTATVKLILDEEHLKEYRHLKDESPSKIFEPKAIDTNLTINSCNNLAEAYGYYFILENR